MRKGNKGNQGNEGLRNSRQAGSAQVDREPAGGGLEIPTSNLQHPEKAQYPQNSISESGRSVRAPSHGSSTWDFRRTRPCSRRTACGRHPARVLRGVQVCASLPYRNAAAFGRPHDCLGPLQRRTPGRLQVCATADYKSALRLRTEAALSGPAKRRSAGFLGSSQENSQNPSNRWRRSAAYALILLAFGFPRLTSGASSDSKTNFIPPVHAVVHVPPELHRFSTCQKLNPVWWLGNADDPKPPKTYRPGKRTRKLTWYFRNPFHNFTFYVIGIEDKVHLRVGRYADRVENPNGGWNWAVCRYQWLRLPFIDYHRGRFEFYIGWRNGGNFGMKLNLWQHHAAKRSQTNPLIASRLT
jgi:hypothetical protein